jgi:hypothetical protein
MFQPDGQIMVDMAGTTAAPLTAVQRLREGGKPVNWGQVRETCPETGMFKPKEMTQASSPVFAQGIRHHGFSRPQSYPTLSNDSISIA